MHQKKYELDYMNAIACLLVILIHVLSLGISSLTPSSWQAALVYYPWRLSAFVVPMFLYTGAVKMAHQYRDRELTWRTYFRYITKRIRNIYLPYVIWDTIYYVAFLRIGYVKGTMHEFFSYLWIGNLSSPFYYIIIVMQFYLLLPLWIWMVNKIPPYLGVSIGLLITFVMQQSGQILSLFGMNFAYADRIFLTYLVFWMIGLYVGKFYEAISILLKQHNGLFLCGTLIFLSAAVAHFQYAQAVYVLNLNNIKLVADFLSIVFLHSICVRILQLPQAVRGILQKLHESSFFVYLSHCLFLTLGTAVLQGRGVTSVSTLLLARFFVCYTIPFLLWHIYDAAARKLRTDLRLLG